jgi:CRP-like cAMP-binding protein
VQSIPKRGLLGRLRNEPDFAQAWAAHLAREIQIMRFRSEVLSLKTVASRLDAWLAWQGELPLKGQWKEVANQIGVSPEALYREMAKRRD